MTFLVDLDEPVEVAGGDDAADAQWRPVADVQAEGLAFDHARILADALEKRSQS